MIKLITKILLFSSLIFLQNILFASQPKDSVYLEGENSYTVILIHGKGKHPRWKVVEPLRININKELKYHTLSLQMPNKRKEFKEYAKDFPKAYSIINEAINYLRNEKKIKKIYLIGHSMGSRMAGAFVANNKNDLKGLVVLGCRNTGKTPLSCINNIKNLELPLLDIWGGDNSKDKESAKSRKYLVGENYTQVEIYKANHRFKNKETELTQTVINWLKKNN